MFAVQMSENELYSRGTDVQRLLRPLSRVPGGPAFQFCPIQQAVVIGIHEGAPAQTDYRKWYFATRCTGYWGNYFEAWSALDPGNRRFYLNKAYLTIYHSGTSPSAEFREFVCLHCDPNEPDEGPVKSAAYKRVPHLHIRAAEQPIPKAHLALTVGDRESVTCDAATLTSALERCIQMIADEIVDRLLASTGS